MSLPRHARRMTLSRRQRFRGGALAITMLLALAACGSSSGGNADRASNANSNKGKTYNLKFSALFQPGSAIQDTIDWYANEVKKATDGRVNFKMYYGGSLLKANDQLSGLQSGRADATYVVPAYTPADLPLWNIAMQPGIVQNPQAEAQTLAWLDQNNKYFQQEQKKAGIKILGYIVIGRLDTTSTKSKIEHLSDLKGKTLRALGPLGTALKEIGVNPVTIEAQEAYQSIQRGVIAGTSGLPLDLIPAQGIAEVAPWLTGLNYGTDGSGTFGISLKVWNSLPKDLQQKMLGVSNGFIDHSAQMLEQYETKACASLIHSGGGVTLIPQNEADAWKAKVGDKLLNDWKNQAKKSGASDQAIESVLHDFEQKGAEFDKSATFTSGLQSCAKKTSAQ